MGDFIKTLTSLIGSIKAKVDGKIGILQKRIDNIPTETVLYTPQTLTEEQQKQARDNIGANDDAGSMFVTITESTQNGTTVYSADKTYDEIVEAVKNGIVPVCNWIDPENTSTYGPQNIRCTYVSTFSFPGMIDFADFLSASDSSLYEVRIDRSNKVQIKYKLLGMTGATAYKDGTGGTVPMPYVGCQNKFLRGDATWADVPEYELPIATNEQLGGVKPVVKTDAMTQDVGVDENGKLYTEPAEGGTDLSLDITGAAAGQIAKISAVDENGVPTAWEPVDMPSGGEEWEELGTVDMSTADVVQLTFDSPVKKILIAASIMDSGYTSANSSNFYRTLSFKVGDEWRPHNFKIAASNHSWSMRHRIFFDCGVPGGSVGLPAGWGVRCSGLAGESQAYGFPLHNLSNQYITGYVSGVRLALTKPADTENTVTGTMKVWGIKA